MQSLGINIELTRETIFIFDTEIHTLVPNLFLQNEDFFIGDRIPLSVSPSLTWLNETINQTMIIQI